MGFPNKYTGQYSFSVFPGEFQLIYTGFGFISQTVDTAILYDNPTIELNIDVMLMRDTSIKLDVAPEIVYDKINLEAI